MIRAGLLALGLILPGVAQAQCVPADSIRTGELTGSFSVDMGAAQTMGAPMAGGTNDVGVQSTGGGITLVIDGRRIALRRIADAATPWDWDASADVAVSADEAGITLGCDVNAMARFQGTAMGVTWQVMVPSPDVMLIRWSMTNPPSAGLFLATR